MAGEEIAGEAYGRGYYIEESSKIVLLDYNSAAEQFLEISR